MGCARWKGARLKDVLDKVGLKKEAIEIAFNGADGPAIDKTPDFIKSIPVWKAIEETTLVAYEMNGAPLPHFNGFPARIVVPGWTGTYWMKHVVSINALTKPLDGFWMKAGLSRPARKIPAGRALHLAGDRRQHADHRDGGELAHHQPPPTAPSVKAGAPTVGGIAWDGGYGIRSVEVSTDGGKTWASATLGEDLGRFAFRTFSLAADRKGKHAVMARATNTIGQTQTTELNPQSGRLSPQRHAQHHAERRLREQIMRIIAIAVSSPPRSPRRRSPTRSRSSSRRRPASTRSRPTAAPATASTTSR